MEKHSLACQLSIIFRICNIRIKMKVHKVVDHKLVNFQHCFVNQRLFLSNTSFIVIQRCWNLQKNFLIILYYKNFDFFKNKNNIVQFEENYRIYFSASL